MSADIHDRNPRNLTDASLQILVTSRNNVAFVLKKENFPAADRKFKNQIVFYILHSGVKPRSEIIPRLALKNTFKCPLVAATKKAHLSKK